MGISQERLSRLESDARGLTLERLLLIANLLGLELVLEDKADTPTPAEEW
ncbi:MAG: helix-turn-helix domain-containing protein [Polyangiaceae bacterium]|nr:helix-turn-helix domain-containing protein [Polyangiaceae bacterium]